MSKQTGSAAVMSKWMGSAMVLAAGSNKRENDGTYMC